MSNSDQYLLNLIKSKVLKKDPRAEVILFGSHARGDARTFSDWDILILLNRATVGRTIEKEFREELFNVELETGQPISTFVFSKEDWEGKHSVTPFYENVKREGILL